MATVQYTFAVRSGGDPTAATGLTPTFSSYLDAETGLTLAPAPSIVEVGGGHYRFAVNWDSAPESTAPTDHIVVTIDAGVAITDAGERYIVSRLNRTDSFATDLSTEISAVEAKVDIIDTNVDAILVDTDTTLFTKLVNIESDLTTVGLNLTLTKFFVDLIYEIQIGKWEVVANQLKIYKSDGVTLVKTFDLFDATGAPTSVSPSRREPV